MKIILAISLIPALLVEEAGRREASFNGRRASDGDFVRQDRCGGPLVILGGGTTTEAVRKKTLELAGGNRAVVVVLADASALPDAGEESVKLWLKEGAAKATKLNLKEPEACVKHIQEATLIWMPGGDQVRLMKALENTAIPGAIRERRERGAVVGGTSAGAAVMSKMMMTGEADLAGISPGKTQLAAGLGLWPAVIVDQHFLKRQRHNRLISAVLDHPDLLGVGIDESTGVVVRGNTFEVIGVSAVVVYDARKSKVENGQALELKMTIVRAGQRFSSE